MKAFAMIYASMIENFLKTRTLRDLNKLSESQLDDIGISRELLTQGVAGFPWRAQDSIFQAASSKPVVVEFKQPAANDDYQLSRAA